MPRTGHLRRTFIGLGSNLGDKITNCLQAVRKVSVVDGVDFVKISCPYETEPFQMASENIFINAVLEINTNLAPKKLLDMLLEIELSMGRDRSIGPDRIIDLDILFMDGIVIDSQETGGRLSLPHPRIRQRAFVLMPWAELAPDLVVEPMGKTVAQMLNELPSNYPVLRRVTWEAERIPA